MSPEQIQGTPIDARSDIFAFGAVMFEVVTGRKAFEAGSQAGVLAAVLEREPPSLATSAPTLPRQVARILDTCLAKAPDDRWQSARDLQRELKAAIAEPESTTGTVPAVRRRKARAWAVAAVVALALGAAAFVVSRRSSRSTPSAVAAMRFQIQTPPTSEPMSLALSPDGRQLAFVATADGGSKLLVRSLDRLVAKPLEDTDGATFPFWSPDSRGIAYFGGGKLKIADVDGGGSRTIADAPNGRGGTWNRDGTILTRRRSPAG